MSMVLVKAPSLASTLTATCGISRPARSHRGFISTSSRSRNANLKGFLFSHAKTSEAKFTKDSRSPSGRLLASVVCSQEDMKTATLDSGALCEICESEWWSMANFSPSSTGLKMMIWVSNNENVPHGPRIKVATIYGASSPMKTRFFTITVSDEPRVIGDCGEIKPHDVEELKRWILKNRASLMDVWNCDTDIPGSKWEKVK